MSVKKEPTKMKIKSSSSVPNNSMPPIPPRRQSHLESMTPSPIPPKRPGTKNTVPKLIVDGSDYLPPEDPLLKLNTQRCKLVEEHAWVKDLYEWAVIWKNKNAAFVKADADYNQKAANASYRADQRIKEYKAEKNQEVENLKSCFNKNLREKELKISDLNKRIEEIKTEVALLPSKEERLSATHVAVENSYWRNQNDRIAQLEKEKTQDRAKIMFGVFYTAFSSVFFILHFLHLIP